MQKAKHSTAVHRRLDQAAKAILKLVSAAADEQTASVSSAAPKCRGGVRWRDDAWAVMLRRWRPLHAMGGVGEEGGR